MSTVDKLIRGLKNECTFFEKAAIADDIINKMCEICLDNRLSAEEFVSSWIAFVTTKHLSSSKPTIELLEQLNREELEKKVHKKSMDSQSDICEDNDIIMDEGSDELLEAYGTPVLNAPAVKRQTTPKGNTNKRRQGQKKNPIIFSPKESPETSGTPGTRYSLRTNSGDCLSSYGKTSVSWQNEANVPVSINAYDEASTLTKRYSYLFEKLPSKARILNQWLEDMGLQLSKAYDITFVSATEISVAVKQTILARVWTDGLGKLNINHLRVECPLQDEIMPQISLDVSCLSQFSFFPGQLIAIEGTRSQEKFVVDKLYDGLQLPFANCITNAFETGASLQLVVAAGPFTTTDDFSYSPLMDLLNYIDKHKPHVCILIGPFVDSKSDTISKHIESQNNDLCSYDDVFEFILDNITNKIDRSRTQLVIIPSLRDLHHTHYVYPTAPFTHSKMEGVHFMPDPCVLDINGVTVGITSADILFHLSREELASTGSTDRLGRLAGHILKQQSFYPLSPPHEDVNIDYQHFDLHGGLPITPDILILPSDLKHFIKNVEGCCCINPERLVKGCCGGTFARINVDPHKRIPDTSVIDSISAQVIRI